MTTPRRRTPQKKPPSSKIFAALIALLLLALVGVGACSLFGGDSGTSASSSSASAGATSVNAPEKQEPKKTEAGNLAIAHERSAEERRATSTSANNVTPGPKTVYLTFDDGPSTNTHRILEILDSYGVKATWFVKGDQPQLEYVKDIWDAGNQVASTRTRMITSKCMPAPMPIGAICTKQAPQSKAIWALSLRSCASPVAATTASTAQLSTTLPNAWRAKITTTSTGTSQAVMAAITMRNSLPITPLNRPKDVILAAF